MRLRIRNIHSVLLITGLIFVAIGCSTNSSDSSDTATIQGSVNGEVSQQKIQANSAEGAMVSAARVTSNGSFETIDGTETETDASGNFTMNVDVESHQQMVIIAEKGGQQWKGFLTSNVENGASYTLKPLDMESSAETAVFAKLVASGDADIVSKSDIEAVIQSETAAEIHSSTSATARIASGLKKAAQARAEYYSETLGNSTESSLATSFDAMAEAQLWLESELNSVNSEEQRDEAYEMFAQAMVEAHTEAGLTISEAATSIEMWNRVVVDGTTSVSSEIKNSIRKNASIVAAVAIDAAVRAEAEAAESSDNTKDAVIQAGTNLKAAIKASAGAVADIHAAFDEYHEEVRTALENESSVQASIVITVDSEINSSNGFKSAFQSSLSGMLNAEVMNDVYSSYYTNIKSTVENENTSSDVNAEALARMMFLINLCS